MGSFSEVRLHTARLVLRAIEAGDAPAIFEMYANAEVARYGSRPPMTALREAEEWVGRAVEDIRNGESLRLAVVRSSDRVFLGTCAIWAIHADSRRAEVGYGLARPYWGNGYMREAMRALVGHGFGELGLNRLEADADPRNTPSIDLLEQLGFTREGYMPERWIVNGEVCDTVFYGLLRRDWASGRGGAPGVDMRAGKPA